ncbi:transmembrane protease serine 9-like [Eurosta solidaginis]|uniref:transmembrane protease serine 9-like n=1 Tax=Eurosta solidaginis TaxID=178769 RepID=UPI0035309555
MKLFHSENSSNNILINHDFLHRQMHSNCKPSKPQYQTNRHTMHGRLHLIRNVFLLFLQLTTTTNIVALKFSALLDGRIVGGQLTTIDEVPYLLNLRRDGQFTCGGSLVTKRCVLTAAHCVKGVSPSSLTVHAGASRLSDVGETRQVEKYFLSPFYSTATLDMDVAILKLSNDLSGTNIATIGLCNTNPADGQFIRITGWGLTNELSEQPSDQVRTTLVPLVSKIDCIKAYLGKALLTSTMFCATLPGEKDSCSGDSGGPVVYDGRVCGIVSWGFGCARKEYPGVYTNVSSRRVNAFIKQTLMQNFCSAMIEFHIEPLKLSLITWILYNYFIIASCTNKTIIYNITQNETISDKIIGGDFVPIHGAPFIVSLRSDNRFICGGSLLRRNCILTAAHCVVGLKANRLTVHGGTTVLSNKGKTSRVSSFYVPRGYKEVTQNQDVAILRLTTPLNGNNINLVNLANVDVKAGQRLRVYGWGTRREDADRSSLGLRAATVQVIKRSVCNQDFGPAATLSRTMFCASLPGKTDSCAGDSGGPLMAGGLQYGIVSWGFGCGLVHYPGVNTSIKSMRTWIDQIVSRYCQ